MKGIVKEGEVEGKEEKCDYRGKWNERGVDGYWDRIRGERESKEDDGSFR